jgi:hypothetical protein
VKPLLLSIAVLLSASTLFGQEPNAPNSPPLSSPIHSPGDASISLSGNVVSNAHLGSRLVGGFKMRVFVGNRISLDADLLIRKGYSHFGPGLLGLPLWLLDAETGSSGEEDGSFRLFLLKMATGALSVEHIAYHLPIRNTIDISPFVSALRLTQLEGNTLHATFVAGVEVNRYVKRFVLSPYIEYSIAYGGDFRGFNVGMNFGYYIPKFSKEVEANSRTTGLCGPRGGHHPHPRAPDPQRRTRPPIPEPASGPTPLLAMEVVSSQRQVAPGPGVSVRCPPDRNPAPGAQGRRRRTGIGRLTLGKRGPSIGHRFDARRA